MLSNAYFLAKIGANTAENEQHFAEILPIGGRVADRCTRRTRAATACAPLDPAPFFGDFGDVGSGAASAGADGAAAPGSSVPLNCKICKINKFSLPPQGASAQLVGTQQPTKQIRNIVRFFSRISGGPGDGPQIVRFFSRISGGPGMVRRL